MKPVNRFLAGLVLLLAASHAHAEYRTVLVQIKQDKDKNTIVTIHSDEKKEQKAAVSVDDAVKLIGEMKGWGSSVGVYVVSDRSVSRADLNKLLAAVNDNHWLALEYFGRDVPKVVGDHFLKEGSKAALPSEPPQLQEARRLDGVWVVTDDGGENPVRPTGHARGSRWIIEQGSITFGYELKLEEKNRIGRYFRVDPTKNPKTIEISLFAKRAGSGPPGFVEHGIYELKGDRLKLYVDGLGKDKMPLAFPAEGGTAQHRVLTLERERPR